MQIRPQHLLDYREFPVLYVDDEPENLRILELAFRREFTLLTARSGDEGLALLDAQPVAVVLSDQRMPGMTGVEFLERARARDPKTIRLLITAYGDAETLEGAINEGSIYRYVPKPWRPEELRLALKRAIEVYALDREREDLLREVTLLNRIAQTINQELELGPLLERLLDAVGELDFDGATILLVDERREALAFARSAPPGDAARLDRLSIRRSEAPSFFHRLCEGEVQRLAPAQAASFEAPLREWLATLDAGEVLVIPLIGRRHVVGALAVDTRHSRRSFNAADRVLLDGVAIHAVIAIENAQQMEDLRRSRQQVVRAERLGTLGTLAAGLAHEINNPLVSIQTFLSLAPEKAGEDDPEFWGEYHRLALAEVERIRGLVASMGKLARDGESDAARVPCELPTLAREAATLLAREAQEAGVELVLASDAETPKVLASPQQLHQVLLNLLLNAIQATPEGGRVRVHTRRDVLDGRPAAGLEVRDSGPGIPEQDLERIFDPFYTTKGPADGTGLGLVISHRIVADHQGSLEVSNPPEGGASFRVRLPVEPNMRPASDV